MKNNNTTNIDNENTTTRIYHGLLRTSYRSILLGVLRASIQGDACGKYSQMSTEYSFLSLTGTNRLQIVGRRRFVII